MKLQDITSKKPFNYLAEDFELCTEVQQALQHEGLYYGIDGIYGTNTENALVTYKRNKRLSGGNFIGPTTAVSLIKSLESPVVLVTREQANFVYQTQLYDAEFKDLNDCLLRFSITAKEDIREFLAQTAHESGGLKYSKELASGWDYEWREDLGNTQAGDGPKYKGCGYLQVTGRSNHQRFADSVNDQEVMRQGCEYTAKVYPASISGFWWRDNNVSQKIANGATLTQISALVNTGSMYTSAGRINGLDDRAYFYRRAQEVI
jgi:putative chitinase